jgi:hypothetical protein
MKQGVDEAGSNDGIPSNADAGALTNVARTQLLDCLIGQRATSGNTPHRTLLVDRRRHDSNLGFSRRDDAGTIGSNEPAFFSVHEVSHFDHVQDRNSLGNTDHQLDLSIHRFHDGIGGKGRRHQDHAGAGTFLFHGLMDGIEDGHTVLAHTPLTRSDSGDNLGAVFAALGSVKASFPTSNPLNHYLRVFIDPDSHNLSPGLNCLNDFPGGVRHIRRHYKLDT